MKVILFIVCLAIFLLGLFLMASAFAATGAEAVTFIGGILCVALAFAIPVHLLEKFD